MSLYLGTTPKFNFICNIFNDAISKLEFIASNTELERKLKKTVMAKFKVLSLNLP